MDELLKSLYAINAKSSHEEDMIEFVINYTYDKFPNIIIETDDKNNIYITKGTTESYPCIVAHLDEVHIPTESKNIFEYKDCIFGYDDVKHDLTGIGADDKNGIFIALKMLEEFPELKCAFFVEEEIGCGGSTKADITFFDDCRFVLQCDRKGNSDLITEISNVALCSEEFIKDVNPSNYNYHKANGLFTDVKALKTLGLKVSCCNISCGYYNPHTRTEYTNITDLNKCMDFVRHIIKDCTKIYTHEYKEQKYDHQGQYYIPYKNLMNNASEDISLLDTILNEYFETYALYYQEESPKDEKEFLEEYAVLLCDLSVNQTVIKQRYQTIRNKYNNKWRLV